MAEAERVMPMTLGDRIVLLLRRRSWQLTDLAEATEIPASTLSRYVNDETQPPPARVVAIATALEVTPNDLLGFPADASSGESSTARESSFADWAMAESPDTLTPSRRVAFAGA